MKMLIIGILLIGLTLLLIEKPTESQDPYSDTLKFVTNLND